MLIMNLNVLLGDLSLHSVTEAGELLFWSEYYQYFFNNFNCRM